MSGPGRPILLEVAPGVFREGAARPEQKLPAPPSDPAHDAMVRMRDEFYDVLYPDGKKVVDDYFAGLQS
jgi:hypothetical protein